MPRDEGVKMITQSGFPLGTLRRWAERKGTILRWGNVIGTYAGQEFEETFRTVAQAKERERQALAGEAIGPVREPVALRRRDLRPKRAL